MWTAHPITGRTVRQFVPTYHLLFRSVKSATLNELVALTRVTQCHLSAKQVVLLALETGLVDFVDASELSMLPLTVWPPRYVMSHAPRTKTA